MPAKRRPATRPQFTRRSYQIYRDDAARAAPDYTLEEFRVWLAGALGSRPLCAYCNQTLTPRTFSVDHSTPLKRGGRASLSNLQLVCSGCNKAKGFQTDAEYRDLLRVLEAWSARHRNPGLMGHVIHSLKIAQSFRQGAMRRAKG